MYGYKAKRDFQDFNKEYIDEFRFYPDECYINNR